jgi:hypothetical protein
MIKQFSLFLVLAVSILSSCSNDFDLIDNKKEIPVVYGILSRFDTAHYIRIERAFADEETSALTLAKNIDSLYYPADVQVQLIRVRDNRAYTLTRVDGNKEGYKRESGNFVNDPNYLYKIKASEIELERNQSYKLLVKRNDGSVITEATTTIVPQLTFIENRTLFGSPAKFNANTAFTISWNTDSPIQNCKMYDVQMLFKIRETPKDGSPERVLDLTWNIARNYIPTGNNLLSGSNAALFKIDGSEPLAFYKYLALQFGTEKPATRKIEGLRIKVTGVGNELYEYYNIGNINTGITGIEVTPTYSNILNGYGVFSSRGQFMSQNIILSDKALIELTSGSITGNLGFTN